MKNEEKNQLINTNKNNKIHEAYKELTEEKKKNLKNKNLILEKIQTKKSSNLISYEKMNKLDQMKALNEENFHLKEMLFDKIKDKINLQEDKDETKNINFKCMDNNNFFADETLKC